MDHRRAQGAGLSTLLLAEAAWRRCKWPRSLALHRPGKLLQVRSCSPGLCSGQKQLPGAADTAKEQGRSSWGWAARQDSPMALLGARGPTEVFAFLDPRQELHYPQHLDHHGLLLQRPHQQRCGTGGRSARPGPAPSPLPPPAARSRPAGPAHPA